MKVCSLISGGQDSLAVTLEMIEKFGKENVIGLGIQYGQRHFSEENKAAILFCNEIGIPREIIEIPIYQINKGRCLTDQSIDVPDNLEEQVDTVVNFRNTIFTTFAAGYAIQNGCNAVALGVNYADFSAYKDCRPIFYKLLNMALQAGLTETYKGSNLTEDDIINDGYDFYIPDEKLDIKILTPIINETKIQTVKRVADKYGVEIYKNSWSCYNGGLGKYKNTDGNPVHCGVCPACRERKESFEVNNLIDPIEYYKG